MEETNLTFRVDRDLRESFTAFAKSKDRTPSQLLRDLMRVCVQQPLSYEDWLKQTVGARIKELENGGKLLTHEEAGAKIEKHLAELRARAVAKEKNAA
jgi:predicted transcriptional regulator